VNIEMNLSINKELFSLVPQLKIGIIHYTKIVVSQSPQMLKGRMQLFQENLFFELQESPVTERPGIKEWRTVWKALGADPNRYRHSAESLMRRIAKQNYLSPVHLAVDLNNFFSLEHEIPIGIYDVDHIVGDVEINLGNEETGYDGLNGRYNKLTNILYSKDEKGAFGSPFVDSVRTSVTEETTEALQIFYLRPSLEDYCNKLLSSCGKMFTQVAGGEFTTALLSADNPSVTIEVKK
jgi:DNA/RNA-binding domain of Phe-tRNA-synthetase-like protein